MDCPKCGREMLDQRSSKSNPKQPDYTCSDPGCLNEKGYRTGVWLQKKAPTQSVGSAAVARGPKWTWRELYRLHRRCMLIASKNVLEVAEKFKVPAPTEAIVAAAATVFIAATRDGVREDVQDAPLNEPPPQVMATAGERMPWDEE